jgi:gluconate 2-dehydrogenase gamma chain
VERRAFLDALLRAAVAGSALAWIPACRRGCAPTESPRAARTFDEREWAVVEAAASRIVPTDDLPGAREANVVGFIDAELASPHFAVFRREFEAGVSALELVAAARFGARFLEIAAEDQDVVLRAIQDGEGSAGDFSAAHFFQVLFVLTLEGLLSDPAHGGNRDQSGWKVIGYFPAPPRPSGA